MQEEHFGSPTDFAEQLTTHLAALGDPALPSGADLAALVEAAFFASLYEEESRRTQFGIAWQPGPHGCAAIVAIAPPVRATPRNLTKLAPATWHDTTSIAVRRGRENSDFPSITENELVAWALLEHTEHQPLTIRVLGPGILRVDHGGEPCALYARGEILFSGAAHRVTSPVERLVQTFSTLDATRASIIVALAMRSLAHGHGGMILVTPARVATPVGVRVHYAITDGANLLADRADAIELVARLTAVDNALLVDTELRLRGFAVQVLEGDAPAGTFDHTNPYTNDTHVDDLSTFKGTRHPAGVIFCMRQPCEAAAIIGSQDGRLSLVTKSADGRVTVLGSYERGFGWR